VEGGSEEACSGKSPINTYRINKMVENLLSALHRYASNRALCEVRAGQRTDVMTYGDLNELSGSIASALRRLPLNRGEAVVLYQTRSAEQVASAIAVLRAGGYFCPVDARAPAAYVGSLVARTKAPMVLVDERTLGALGRECALELGSARVAVVSPTGLAIINGGQARPEVDKRPRTMLDAGCCLFTSGSTGVPKGVLIGVEDLLKRSQTEAVDLSLTSSDVLLGLLPFSFDVGLNQLLACLLSGAELVICHSWFPMDITQACEHLGVGGIAAVPAIWTDFLRLKRHSGVTQKLSSLRYVTVSAGSMAKEELLQLRALLPRTTGIFRTYGQTETFRSTILRPSEFDAKMLSVGRAVQGTEVAVLRESGDLAAAHEVGEIVHSGAGTMLEYLDDERATLEKLRASAASGGASKVVRTGDLGFLDEDGFLHILGRRDRMIKCSGFRVYPSEIEQVLRAHEAVRDAAVFATSDSRVSQAIVAHLVADGSDRPSVNQLKAFVAQRLPSYMVPRDIIWVDALPRTLTGKLDYAAIEAQHRATV